MATKSQPTPIFLQDLPGSLLGQILGLLPPSTTLMTIPKRFYAALQSDCPTWWPSVHVRSDRLGRIRGTAVGPCTTLSARLATFGSS